MKGTTFWKWTYKSYWFWIILLIWIIYGAFTEATSQGQFEMFFFFGYIISMFIMLSLVFGAFYLFYKYGYKKGSSK